MTRPPSVALTALSFASPASHLAQVVSGVSLEAYWFSSYVWDFVSYLIPMSFAIILFKIADVSTLFDNGAVKALVLLFLLFGLSMVRIAIIFAAGVSHASLSLTLAITVRLLLTADRAAYRVHFCTRYCRVSSDNKHNNNAPTAKTTTWYDIHFGIITLP